ncbi:MAG: DUF2059 domain-containing protein [Terriglobales bacterium]|jgi:hypothetical protein
MKRLLLVVGLVLVFSGACIAQTSADDSPATKADVEQYFQIVKSHDMMKKLMASMSQSLHQITHEQYLKHKDELPADYESKMTARMDELFDNMPWDEMTQAMVPAYQKHFTKGDIDNLVAFYSSPTGEKLLRELPSVTAESMQNMMPILIKYTDTVKQTLLKETDVMIAQSKKQSNANAPTTHN